MSKFTKYKSIPKSYEVSTINYYKANGFLDTCVVWEVTEKVHGANYSFLYDAETKTVQHAKRSEILGGEESLFGSRLYAKDWERRVYELGEHLMKDVQVVTEIYGKGVTKSPYIPYVNDNDKHFVAYDLMVDGVFVPYVEAVELFKKFDIPYLPILFSGTFEDCLKFEVNGSLLAKENGIETRAEGKVLKPANPIYTASGERVILKDVSPQFQENKLNKEQLKEVERKRSESETFNKTKVLVENCLTDMRVSKVAAKFGFEAVPQNFKNILDAVLHDIAEEIRQEYEFEINVKASVPLVVPLIKKYVE